MIRWNSTRCDLCGETGSNYRFRSGFEFQELIDSNGFVLRTHMHCRFRLRSAFYDQLGPEIAKIADEKLGLGK